LNGPL